MPKQIQYHPELVHNALTAYALGIKKGMIAEKLGITRYHLNKMIKDFESLQSEKYQMLLSMHRRDQFREKKLREKGKKNKPRKPVGYKKKEEDPLFLENPFEQYNAEQVEEKPKKKRGKKKLLEIVQDDDELPEDQEFDVDEEDIDVLPQPKLRRQQAVEVADDEESEEEDLDLIMDEF